MPIMIKLLRGLGRGYETMIFEISATLSHAHSGGQWANYSTIFHPSNLVKRISISLKVSHT